MKCLYCGMQISDHASADEKTWCWHKKCVKDFFHVNEMPVLDITKEQLEQLAKLCLIAWSCVILPLSS